MGHNAASARHAHEQQLFIEAASLTDQQTMLADRALNHNPQDICRLDSKWRLGNYGSDSGKDLFQKLQENLDLYNQKHGKEREKALLQWYSACEPTGESEEDEDLAPLKKEKD